MKYMFICPKCKDVYYAELESPFGGANCPECHINAHYIGITKPEWDKLDQPEKDKITNGVLDDYKLPSTQYLLRLSNDVHTIRNIIIWLTVLSIIAGIFLFLAK